MEIYTAFSSYLSYLYSPAKGTKKKKETVRGAVFWGIMVNVCTSINRYSTGLEESYNVPTIGVICLYTFFFFFFLTKLTTFTLLTTTNEPAAAKSRVATRGAVMLPPKPIRLLRATAWLISAQEGLARKNKYRYSTWSNSTIYGKSR